MAPNLIRDCDAAYDQLLELGKADSLSPENGGAVCRLLIGRLGDLALWAHAAEPDPLNRAVRLLIQTMTRRLCRVHQAVLTGTLTAAQFEEACTDLGEGFETLTRWADRSWAPVAPARMLTSSDARTPVTVYERGPRRFAVIEGGLA